MQEKLMKKGEWVKPSMTVTEWMTAVNTGYRREYLNAKNCAEDHAVWKGIKDPHGSIAGTIKSCLAELSGCKFADVYPDLQNKKKLPYDLIIGGWGSEKDLTVDIKTPDKKESDWVCVAEKYEHKKCDLYLFIYSETPPLVFDQDKKWKYLGVNPRTGEDIRIPILKIGPSIRRFKDHIHGCRCIGWQRGDYIFRPENKRRPDWSESGFFIRRDELLDNLEDCLD